MASVDSGSRGRPVKPPRVDVPNVGRFSASSGRVRPRTKIGLERAHSSEVLDEVEQAGVGPLKVLEHEDRRLLVRRATR